MSENHIHPQKLSKKILTFFRSLISRLMFSQWKNLSINFELAGVTPIFKKYSKYSKYNYKSISILKDLSKRFEKIVYKQMATFVNKYFSTFLEKATAHSNMSLHWLKNGKVLLIGEYLLELC